MTGSVGAGHRVPLKNRIVHDFAYILVAHGLFERFPRLKVAYIENGCAWVPSLLQALEYLGHGGGFRAIRGTSSSSTAGSHRSSRRASTSSPVTFRSSASCSAPTGRTARGSRSRGTSSRTSPSSPSRTSGGSCTKRAELTFA